MPLPGRYHIQAEVLQQRSIIGREFEIVLSAPEAACAAEPGQFVEMLVEHAVARRPFSIFDADPVRGTFSILYIARGPFTSELSRKVPGDHVDVIAPLGTPFKPSVSAKHHVLVAGGIGAPPMVFLARRLVETAPCTAVTVIVAARTRELLVGLPEFEALQASVTTITDDGSHGRQGIATDALMDVIAANSIGTAVYACGPMGMLRSVGACAVDNGLPCQVSIETPMPCGIGSCSACAVALSASQEGREYALACVDGPVFDYRALRWD